MTASEALEHLEQRGVRMYLSRGDLRYHAPRGAYTAELRALVAQHRMEIVRYLWVADGLGNECAAKVLSVARGWKKRRR